LALTSRKLIGSSDLSCTRKSPLFGSHSDLDAESRSDPDCIHLGRCMCFQSALVCL